MKKCLTLVLTLAMLLFLLCGCGGAPASNAGGSSGDSGGGVATPTAAVGDANDVYYMISYLSTLEFWDDCYAGFQSAASIWGAQTEYTGAPGVDAAAQITVLEQVMATNPAGIAITVCDATALDDTIDKAIESNLSTFYGG